MRVFSGWIELDLSNMEVAMKILQFLKLYFAADVISRAKAYVHGRAVRILQASPSGIWATVRGSSTYNSAMTLEDDGLHM